MSLAFYPYAQSYWDHYGSRKGTLGLMLHMAEGTGTVGYLDDHIPPGGNPPPRGVSANYVCQVDGVVVRMLDWNATSGSLNPANRSTDKAYYGHEHLVDVLGEHWTDPNPWVISIEIEGFAATGPNGRQQKALVDWAADMVKRYPTIRGALGHADQTNTKGCPGTTPEMKAVFASIGGHGLWTKEEPVGPEVRNLVSFLGTATIKGDGHGAILANDGSVFPLPNGASKEVVAKGNLVTPWPNHADTTVYLVGSEPAYLLAEDVVIVATPPVNCDDKVAAELERAAVRAHDAVLAA